LFRYFLRLADVDHVAANDKFRRRNLKIESTRKRKKTTQDGDGDEAVELGGGDKFAASSGKRTSGRVSGKSEIVEDDLEEVNRTRSEVSGFISIVSMMRQKNDFATILCSVFLFTVIL
jgi:hypothetical protein